MWSISIMQPTWRTWSKSNRKNGQKLLSKLVVTYPNRYKIFIAVKGGSTKHYSEGIGYLCRQHFSVYFSKDLLANNEFWLGKFTLREYCFAIEMLTGIICASVICKPDKSDEGGWILLQDTVWYRAQFPPEIFTWFRAFFFCWEFEHWGHHAGRDSWLSFGFWDWSSM